MIRRTRQGIGNWLALFAMLMIYVGPLVSQSLPMDHAMPMGHSMPMEHGQSMQHEHGAAMAGMDHGKGHSATARVALSPFHGKQPLAADAFMEKCGYCSLLIHSPSLTPPAILLGGDLPAAGTPVAQPVSLAVPASPVFPGARSRAPPALIG